MIESTVSFIYWLMAGLIVYTYAGYPLLLWLRFKLGGSRRGPRHATEPLVSILVIAHNEAARMERKINNLLALDYPKEKLEIVVASDASTDGTVALVESYRGAGIALRAFQQHRGKPAVLNAVVPTLGGEIVVLMDARQTVEPQALRELLANFADPRVGAVSGELMLVDGRNGGAGVGFYWRYEKALRQFESKLDSTVGVTGAFYALRRHLFEPIPVDTLLDDVLIPMQVVRQGYRVLLEPLARAYDDLALATQTEHRRKVRTLAGNYQLFFRHAWLLNPVANRLWWQTVSHKLCRLLCPVALALVFAMNLLLLDRFFYQVLLLAQFLFYLLAFLAHASSRLARCGPVFSVPHAFCLLNWCAVVGGYRFLRGSQRVTWAKAPPEESSTSAR
jgi:cellulose synthase/poly-beta-1,6-N-acetylglucosamine synthase-like glycosyltransferase